ncbi:MAG: M14 family zinc carboxypeptidase, partial [Candidatus Thermoplasmatota archaeon]|nr:M14 family zinc carboxypeptidase [Candidatus Thermoplasmatota archaeon]
MKHKHLLVAIFLLLTPLAGCFDSSVQGPVEADGINGLDAVERGSEVEWGPEVSERASEWLRQDIRDEIYDQVYYHYWDLREHMEALQQDHSEIMRLSTIGRSVDGELDPFNDYGKLLLAEVTNLSDPTPKPQILIDGGHHGNEQLGMEVAMLLLDYLVTEYEEDAWVK